MLVLKSYDGKKTVEGRRILNDDGTATAYIITEDGHVYSEELNAYRRNVFAKNGYYMISISINNKWKMMSVHSLVAKYFLSNEYNHPCINHKDCNHKNNHYIPPLADEDEPVYKKRSEYDPEDICEALSQPEYLSNTRGGVMFHVSPKLIKQIRTGKIHSDISSKYNINNNCVKSYRTLPEDRIKLLYELAQSGKYTIGQICTIIGTTTSTFNNYIYGDDEMYTYYRPKDFTLNVIENHKGHKLTDDTIKEATKLINTGKYTREEIAKICNISIASVTKIKRKIKESKLK